jgi:hypothetical protein
MNDLKMKNIFSFITDNSIELSEDPLRMGPKYLNGKVAECRNLTTRLQEYERVVIQYRLIEDRTLNNLESTYEMTYNDMLANDPRVLKKTSAKDREATVKSILQDQITEIEQCKSRLTDLGHVQSIIKSKLVEFQHTNRDIRLQMQIIQDEIKLGNFWGDESEKGQHKINPVEIDITELDSNYDPENPPEKMQFGDNNSSASSSIIEDVEQAMNEIEIPDSLENIPRKKIHDVDLEGLFDDI